MAGSPLQKSPLALLGAFALKQLGVNPTHFGEEIQPSIDVYDQYLYNEQRISVTLSAAGIALGTSHAAVSVTVPAAKAWRVLGIAGVATPAAGDAGKTFNGFLSVRDTLSQEVALENRQLLGTGAAIAGDRILGYQPSNPIFLPSGWKIAFVADSSVVTAANVPLALNVFVQEIDQ